MSQRIGAASSVILCLLLRNMRIFVGSSAETQYSWHSTQKKDMRWYAVFFRGGCMSSKISLFRYHYSTVAVVMCDSNVNAPSEASGLSRRWLKGIFRIWCCGMILLVKMSSNCSHLSILQSPRMGLRRCDVKWWKLCSLWSPIYAGWLEEILRIRDADVWWVCFATQVQCGILTEK